LVQRTRQKIRARERGWEYGVRSLVAAGAASPADSEDLAAWLARWEPRLMRLLPHPGNFKYAWALQPRHRRYLPAGLPYPKVVTPQMSLFG